MEEAEIKLEIEQRYARKKVPLKGIYWADDPMDAQAFLSAVDLTGSLWGNKQRFQEKLGFIPSPKDIGVTNSLMFSNGSTREGWEYMVFGDPPRKGPWSQNYQRTKIIGSVIDLGSYYLSPRKGIAIVIPPPHQLRNARGQLHNPEIKEKSVWWDSGYGFHYWNGVLIPDKYIKKQYSVKTILRETNLEIRRSLIDIVGAKDMAKLCKTN